MTNMLENAQVSRRTFMKGSALAGLGAAAMGTGAVSLFGCSPSADGAKGGDAAATQAVEETTTWGHCAINCPGRCSLKFHVQDDEVAWVETYTSKDAGFDEVQPRACLRGRTYRRWLANPDRINYPMKRVGKRGEGKFEQISWDEAVDTIASELKRIIDEYGNESVYIPYATGVSSTTARSLPRFMNCIGGCLGSYGDYSAMQMEMIVPHTYGASGFSGSTLNAAEDAALILAFGTSPTETRQGGAVSHYDWVHLRETTKGKMIYIDPRMNDSVMGRSAEWQPINPGTDLALLMAMANVLIEEDLYDHDFVEQNTYGFEEFAEQAKEYTPEWAEKITDVPAETIQELARSMAKAAPAASIESGWRSVIGCSYKNSFETARAITAINSLLGCWGAKGGALITSSPKAGAIEDARFKAPAKPAAKRIGDAEYPLVLASAGTNVAALQATLEGEIKGLFFYNSNAAKGYAQPKKWTEALEKTDLVVTIDVQMSETAQQSDYVLPEVTYLERLELPEFVGGKKHYVGMRTVALEKIHPETRTCDEIFNGLAEACGVGEYFQFTAEDWAEAQLATVGVSLDQMKKEGVVELPDPHFEYGVPTFKTASGKFEFKTDKVGEAGLNPVIGWIPRKVTPQSGEFAIVGGKQGIHSHTMTQNIEALHAISREYHMERLWMAAKDAADLGVQTGDTVEVSSSEHTGQVEVRVTQRLKPGVVFLPTHYGGDAPAQTRAYHYGISLTDFIPLDAEPGVGSMMSQEVAVTVKKVEA